MGFIAKDTGGDGNFKRIPPGVYVGRCYSLIDLGTQTETGKFGVTSAHKIRIQWELFGDDDEGNPLTIDVDGKEMPLTISKKYTVSLHEKANLRKELAAWRGKDFTEDEAKAFDISKLVGHYCMINIVHSDTNGKIYANVAGISPLPSALKNQKPAPVHDNFMFDLDDPDMELFATFYDKLQETIKASPEWAASRGREMATPGGFPEADDPIPF